MTNASIIGQSNGSNDQVSENGSTFLYCEQLITKADQIYQ